MPFPHHPAIGFNPGAVFADVIAALFFLVCLVIVVGVLLVFIRFLLVTTKAAEVYVAKNGGTMPKWFWTGSGTSASAPVAAEPVVKPTTTRTRATKTAPPA
jgi:hypothetical protein